MWIERLQGLCLHEIRRNMWILNLYSYISSEMRRFRQKKVLKDCAFSKEKAGFCTNRGEDCAFSEEKAESCTNRSQDFAL